MNEDIQIKEVSIGLSKTFQDKMLVDFDLSENTDIKGRKFTFNSIIII